MMKGILFICLFGIILLAICISPDYDFERSICDDICRWAPGSDGDWKSVLHRDISPRYPANDKDGFIACFCRKQGTTVYECQNCCRDLGMRFCGWSGDGGDW